MIIINQFYCTQETSSSGPVLRLLPPFFFFFSKIRLSNRKKKVSRIRLTEKNKRKFSELLTTSNRKNQGSLANYIVYIRTPACLPFPRAHTLHTQSIANPCVHTHIHTEKAFMCTYMHIYINTCISLLVCIQRVLTHECKYVYACTWVQSNGFMRHLHDHTITTYSNKWSTHIRLLFQNLFLSGAQRSFVNRMLQFRKRIVFGE